MSGYTGTRSKHYRVYCRDEEGEGQITSKSTAGLSKGGDRLKVLKGEACKKRQKGSDLLGIQPG
jgi:hypothetical protein